METITSRQNPTVRRAAELLASPGERRARREFLCEGARLCRDAALSGLTVRQCFFTAAAREKYAAYLEPVLQASGESFQVADHVAALLSSTKSSQGIYCVCAWPASLEREKAPSAPQNACVVLENLQDPGNLGTVLRTAEALGLRRVILLGECCDPLSPKVLRASMGAVFRLELEAERSPQALCARLGEAGFTLLATVPHREAQPVTELDFSQGRWAVCIGNEGNGLSPETIALCHRQVTIPMRGRAESLNASAAATILLWELARAGKKEDAHG